MNTQNDAETAKDFEIIRKAIVRKCYNVCLDLAQESTNISLLCPLISFP